MTYYIDSRQRASEAKQNSVMRIVYDFGRTAPAALAQRELLESQMALNAQRRALRAGRAGPGPLRSWIGARILALGTRLTGAQVALETSTGRSADSIPTQSQP